MYSSMKNPALEKTDVNRYTDPSGISGGYHCGVAEPPGMV